MGADLGCQLGLQQVAECVETQADRAMVAQTAAARTRMVSPKPTASFLEIPRFFQVDMRMIP